MNIVPFGDRLIVRRLKTEKSAGGIFVTEGASNMSYKGTVVACGPTVGQGLIEKLVKAGWTWNTAVKVAEGKYPVPGDVVLFNMWSGNKLADLVYADTDEERDLLILREDDVLGKIGEEKS